MRDTTQYYGRNERPIFESQRRMTFYEVCLNSSDDGVNAGEHLTELADLGEALESIYARRTERRSIPHLMLGFGASLEASLL